MHADWANLGGWLLALGVYVWQHALTHKGRVDQVVLSAVGLIQKYGTHLPEEEMENRAVEIVRHYLPKVPEVVIRVLIREACAARKRAAGEVGLRDADA